MDIDPWPAQGKAVGPAQPALVLRVLRLLGVAFVAMVFLGGYRFSAAASDHSSRLRLDGSTSVGFAP